eukprot:TRINITY_DN16062_c0_g1_i2.p1 TRINITY_DN16062_c0_g1~~TRINITY_DN16062_c0_g1_i2.p1  ORF type:complete len:114 (+),score=31.13 TRINITY_DN16062_c0_g1_i2:380-721(+)
MQQLYNDKEKELKRLSESEENTKLKQLNEELKKVKARNREIERKIQAVNGEYKNEHDYYLELHERLQKLKQEEATWKKAIAEGKLPNDLHLSLIHICRCRRYAVCRSRWSPYH